MVDDFHGSEPYPDYATGELLNEWEIGHAAADEVTQPGLLPLDHFGDPLVRFECHLLQAR
jgi:hypothetical protein